MVDWTSLPEDLLALIAQKLDLKDFIVFGAVCKSWQSSTLVLEQKPSTPPAFPWIMLAEKRKKNRKVAKKNRKMAQKAYRCFFNPSSFKVYELYLPEASRRKCLGVGFGWLLTLGNDLQINLLHPFSRHKIPLPPKTTFSDPFEGYPRKSLLRIFLRKAVMSSNPWKNLGTISANHLKQEECIVMVINGTFCKLAFAKLGDKAWTNVKVPSQCYEDIVYYKNQFYAVDCHGLVVHCDLDNEEGPRATIIAPPPDGTRDWIQKYLVESRGDLLLVSRKRGGYLYGEGFVKLYCTISFSVVKMEKCVQEDSMYEFCWVPVNDLGDTALFLGFNSSVSLSVTDFNGCFKANCIYFTDDAVESYHDVKGGNDMGIYNMEDGTIEPHFAGESLSNISPPFWYI